MLEIPASWLEQYLSALMLLNVMMGQPGATRPLQPATRESVVRTLNEVARGSYKPAGHFDLGSRRLALKKAHEELVPDRMYTVIVLNGSTPASEFASVTTGGVIFEDPAWAVFAAEGLAEGKMLGVPKARSDGELWDRLKTLEENVNTKSYKAESFLAPVTGFVDPDVPTFTLAEVSGEKLMALRGRGMQSIATPALKFYVLFQRPSAPQ